MPSDSSSAEAGGSGAARSPQYPWHPSEDDHRPTCHECGRDIPSVDASCPRCGALRAGQEYGGSGAGATGGNPGYWISQRSLDDIAEREVNLRAALEAAQRSVAICAERCDDLHHVLQEERAENTRLTRELEATYAVVRNASLLGGLLEGYDWQRARGHGANVAAAMKAQHEALKALPEDVFNAALDAAQAAGATEKP